MKWPTCRGHRTSFLAQIPLADVARIEPGAVGADGTLSLFGCDNTFPKHPTHRLLLQMAFDESLNFAIGDGGSLYLTGTPADLREGRFDRLCAEFQQG